MAAQGMSPEVAAVRVQAAWRGWLGRDVAMRREHECTMAKWQNFKAERIQAVVRGHMARQLVSLYRSSGAMYDRHVMAIEKEVHTGVACVTIQKTFRRHVAKKRVQRLGNRRVAERNVTKYHAAARVIQHACRSMFAHTLVHNRRSYLIKVEELCRQAELRAFSTHSASVIQRNVRAQHSRRRADERRCDRDDQLYCDTILEKWAFKRDAVRTLQRAVRVWIAMQRVCTMRLLSRAKDRALEALERVTFERHERQVAEQERQRRQRVLPYVAALLSADPTPRRPHIALLAADYAPLAVLLDTHYEDPPPGVPMDHRTLESLKKVLGAGKHVATRRRPFWEGPVFLGMSRVLCGEESTGRAALQDLEAGTRRHYATWWSEAVTREVTLHPARETEARAAASHDILQHHLHLAEGWCRFTIARQHALSHPQSLAIPLLQTQHDAGRTLILHEHDTDHTDNETVWDYLNMLHRTPFAIKLQCMARKWRARRRARFIRIDMRYKAERLAREQMEEADYHSATYVCYYVELYARRDIAEAEHHEFTKGIAAPGAASLYLAIPSQMAQYTQHAEPQLRAAITLQEQEAWEAVHDEEKPSFLKHYKQYMDRIAQAKLSADAPKQEAPQQRESIELPPLLLDEMDAVRRHIQVDEAASRNTLTLLHLGMHSTLTAMHATVKDGLKGAMLIVQEEARERLWWGLPVTSADAFLQEFMQAEQASASPLQAPALPAAGEALPPPPPPPVQQLEDKQRGGIVLEECAYRRILTDMQRESDVGRSVAALRVKMLKQEEDQAQLQRDALVRAAVVSFLTACERDEAIRRAECDRLERKSRRTLVTAELRARPRQLPSRGGAYRVARLLPPQADTPVQALPECLAREGPAEVPAALVAEAAPLPPIKNGRGFVSSAPQMTDLEAYEEKYQRLLQVSKRQQFNMRQQQQRLREEEEAQLMRYPSARGVGGASATPAGAASVHTPSSVGLSTITLSAHTAPLDPRDGAAADSTQLRPVFVPWQASPEERGLVSEQNRSVGFGGGGGGGGGHSQRSLPIKGAVPNVTVKQLLRSQTATACLDLEGLDWGEQDIMKYLVALSKNHSITVLKLGGNTITYDLLVVLADLIRSPSCRLVSIRLNGCCLSAPDMEVLLSALAENTSVVGIDISSNPRLDSFTAAVLSDLLTHRRVKRFRELQGQDDDPQTGPRASTASSLRETTQIEVM